MYTTITKQASQLQQIAGISECVTSTSEHGAGPQWVMQRVNDGQIPYRFCEPKCSAYIRGLLTTEDIAFLNEFQTSVDDLRLCSSNQADYRTSDRHERDQVHHDALSTAVFKLYHGVCRVPASWWSTLPCINFFTVLHSGGHWWCTAGEGMGRRGKGGGGGGGTGYFEFGTAVWLGRGEIKPLTFLPRIPTHRRFNSTSGRMTWVKLSRTIVQDYFKGCAPSNTGL